MREDDTIIILGDEQPNTFHVFSKKTGELGIIFKPENIGRFCFKQTDISKYLKAYHLVSILNELNLKNKME